METLLTYRDEAFVWLGGFDTRMTPKQAGFRWDPKKKRWWSKDPSTAALLESFGDDLAKEQLVGVTNSLEASRSHAMPEDFEPDVPDGFELYPYQASGVKWLLEHPNTLLADEMGLGKTIQCAVYLNHLDRRNLPVLILCPASLKVNWRVEMDLWRTWDARIQVLNGGKDAVDPQADVVIVNYDICYRGSTGETLAQVPEWAAVIADECHFLKNPDTLRTQAVMGVKGNKREKVEAVPGLIDKTKVRVMLTGTPIPNRPKELQPIVAKLAPETFGHFFRFAMRYCAANQDSGYWDFNGSSNLDELQVKLRSSVMLRRLKSEVLTELPTKMRGVVVMEPDLACMKVIKQEAQFDPEELHKTLNGGFQPSFESISRWRADLAAAKAPLVAKYVEEQIEAGLEKVIVFAHHTSMIDTLKEKLGKFGVVSITGSTPSKDRQGIVDRFQQDPKVKVFIGNIIAAGVGLTLTAASRVIMAELDWVPGNVTQAEDRAHRIGQKETVLVTHLVVDESLDVKLARTCIEKQKVQDAALDDDVDPHYVREHFEAAARAEHARAAAASEGMPTPSMDSAREARAATRAEKLQKAEEKWGPLSDRRKEVIREALLFMTARDDDYGRQQNQVGWSGQHTNIGHSLAEWAEAGRLSDLQYFTALKILERYKNTQLPHFRDELFPGDAE